MKREMTLIEKMVSAMIICGVLVILPTIIYVAWHFISKYW